MLYNIIIENIKRLWFRYREIVQKTANKQLIRHIAIQIVYIQKEI